MAIAIDNTTFATPSAGTTFTISHTVNSSNNGFLVVNIHINSGGTTDTVTGVTYNGVSMARATFVANTSATFKAISYQYTLIAPASGTHNVVVSKSDSTDGQVWIRSYTGCKQSSNPEATNTNTANLTSSIITTVSTTTPSCWVVAMCRAGTASPGITAGTNEVAIPTLQSSQGAFDSNGGISAGSISQTTTVAATTYWQQGMLAIAPATATTGNFLNFF